MILDYNPKNETFVLRVKRDEGVDIQSLMQSHGLDFSTTASTAGEAVLFTREPFAAVTFFNYGTVPAKNALDHIHALIESSQKISSNANIACPPDRELWPYQKADIEYALQRTNTLVGDHPGLGKTPVAICYANEIKARRVLVICPANIRLQWVRRIWEWTTLRWPVHVEAITHGRKGINPDAHWTVVSYDLARTEGINHALAAGRYDLIILDEAHYLKTIDSRRTRAIFGGGHNNLSPIVERCSNILALTGTPLLNRPREAYTLARGCNWGAIDFASEEVFSERFNPSQRIEGTRVNKETGRAETYFYVDERTGRHFELQNRLRAGFMTRHEKRTVLPQLQLPRYDIIQIEANTAPLKQALQAESLLDIDPETFQGADATIDGHIAVVRRLMGIAMAPQVASYVDMLLQGGEEKIVLFAWHIEVMNILERALAKWGVTRIDATISPTRKQARVDDFIANPAQRVILGNTLTMGTGTDGLQHVAQHALIAEPDWTPGNNIQCFDRLDRYGQQGQVQGDIFVTVGSVAERVLAGALRKLAIIDKALDAKV